MGSGDRSDWRRRAAALRRRAARLKRRAVRLQRPETRAELGHRLRRGVHEMRTPSAEVSREAATTPVEPPDKPAVDPRYVPAWERLAMGVLGAEVTADRAAMDNRTSAAAISAATRQRAQAQLAEALADGERLTDAVRRAVDALARAGQWNVAWSLSEGVRGLPDGAQAALVGHVVAMHRRRQFDRVCHAIESVDPEVLADLVAVEAVDGALAQDSPAGRALVQAITARADRLDAASIVDLTGRLLAYAQWPEAAALAETLRRRLPVDLDERRARSWALLEQWLTRSGTTVPAGAVPVAVIDYQSPDQDLTSGNVGDYVQTLAMLGNLARLTGVRFTGDHGLGDFAAQLQGRVRPELAAADVSGDVHLVAVDRDFSNLEQVPDGTWMIAFGWHMHPLYDLRYDFPYHPNIRPLFVSFHVNRLDMLSDAALDYLRRYGPVGCRDWTTVFLLLSADVDAFFTGCLTTTIDAVFPRRKDVYDGHGAVGLIDIDEKAAGTVDDREVRVFTHQADEFRHMTLVEGLRAASDVLSAYQRGLDRAVTRRLHAYLPLVSLGVPVQFKPWSRGDVRFPGLLGFRPGAPRLRELREELRDLLTQTMSAILGGSDEQQVYALWHELTKVHVEEARRRFEEPVEDPPIELDIDDLVATSKAGQRLYGPVPTEAVTDVVVCFDENLMSQTAVLFESITTNASGPIRFTVLGRGLDPRYLDWLGTAFPNTPITYLPCDHIDYGRVLRKPARITVSTMDRLLLPHLIDSVERAIYLDIDTIVLGDICELAAVDLHGEPFAARNATVSEPSEWRTAAKRLNATTALELQRRMGRKHGYGPRPALNAGVLVLDLERMRADRFSATYLGWIQRYGLHDQDLMLAYAGRDRCVLDPRWNALPALEDVAEPAVIHWASLAKPWDRQLSFASDTWRGYDTQLRARVAEPPPALDPPPGPATPRLERVINAVVTEHISYLGVSSLRNLAHAVTELERSGVPGLIVEAGAALGGSAIVMGAAKSRGRRMKVYDVFGMIPPPGEQDGVDVHLRYENIVAGKSAGLGGEPYYGYRDNLLAEVADSFARHGVAVAEHEVELVQGLFQDTIHLDEPVALAHLDGDWYDSTMTCLTRIAPLLSVGGRLVIDDYYHWSGCRRAVDEYFAGRLEFRFERHRELNIVRIQD
jgi:lipopolysaccharide biosynthesis glycosyltransferase